MKKTLIALMLIFLPLPALGADYFFNPHYIISDEEMTNNNDLSRQEIQIFLESKNSYLADISLPDYNGVAKRPAEIIWQAAQESQISPRVLLTMLQKEQSLIEDPLPFQNQLDKATGYRCFDNALCHPNALGFGKQVDGTAWQLQQYFSNPGGWSFQVGQRYEIDGIFVTPLNQATANLYNYTPHYSGNQNFWRIWLAYWGNNYPDGSLLKAQDDPGVWLIQYGQRRLIKSYPVFLSRFDPRKIIRVSRTDLEKYDIGPDIKFYNYSLLRRPDTGAIYLLADDELRHIVSLDVFKSIGFNIEEVVNVNLEDLAGYKLGSDISVESVYPTGALLKNKTNSSVYYVENGVKHPIYAMEILTANFSKKVLTRVAPEELARYRTGDPVKFKDGELIKAANESEIYVVSDGKRRLIKNEKTFAKFGYNLYNIITTSRAGLEAQPLGADLE